MSTRALSRIGLVVGLLVAIAAIITIREYRTEERGVELALVGALAAGGFMLISGLVGVLSQQPMTEEEEEEQLAAEQTAAGRTPSVATAIGLYMLALAAIAAVIVGIVVDDTGAAIQTFTFGLILGAAVYGLGVLLGHRPVEE
ncbi:MAG: hypothetical protein ACRDJE_06820 [Dehalococcoidia bacterium]